MALAVNRALDRFSIPITHISRSAGGYTDGGRALPRIEDTFFVRAVVQPLGRELMNVPEGKRSEARYLFWSRHFVKEDDIIITPRARCIVLWVWERDEGNFCRAALGRVKE